MVGTHGFAVFINRHSINFYHHTGPAGTAFDDTIRCEHSSRATAHYDTHTTCQVLVVV